MHCQLQDIPQEDVLPRPGTTSSNIKCPKAVYLSCVSSSICLVSCSYQKYQYYWSRAS